MKFRAALALLLLPILSAGGQAAPQGADVVVVAGQSNAVGFGLDAAEVPPELARTSAQVTIWNGRAFVPLSPGHNTGSPHALEAWGPEVAFAARWRQEHPGRPLYIVKYARGSTPLAATDRGLNWAPASNELFAAATAEVDGARAALKAAGLEPNVRCILWLQGEQDAENAGMAAAYGVNLSAFLPKARAAWGEPSTPIALALISQAWPEARIVREAQLTAVRNTPGAVAVDAEDIPRQADGLHYTAKGQLDLGGRMYDACGA